MIWAKAIQTLFLIKYEHALWVSEDAGERRKVEGKGASSVRGKSSR